MINDRLLSYYLTRTIQVIGSNFLSIKNRDKLKILFYPEISNKNVLANIVNRVKWYIPSKKVTVYIITNNTGVLDNLNDLYTPKNHRKVPNIDKWPNIIFVLKETTDINFHDYDLILLWKVSKKENKIIFRYPYKVRIVDPDYFLYTESHTNAALLWYDIFTKCNREQLINISLENITKLFKDMKGHRKAYLFGTGPSIDDANRYKFSDGVRIICNTIVANDQLLEHIRPNVIAFTDSAFHFGISKYCEKFATDLVKVVNKYDSFCITNQVGHALFHTHYPELRNKIIGVPAYRFGGPSILSPNHFKTRDYKYTILTRMMIPLAAGMAKTIFLIGFDGKKTNEKYFWKHNKKSQYHENMNDVWDSHRSFFRDTDYGEHYEGHCKVLSKMINSFEKKGIVFRLLGNSYVPILKERKYHP